MVETRAGLCAILCVLMFDCERVVDEDDDEDVDEGDEDDDDEDDDEDDDDAVFSNTNDHFVS